MSKNLNEAGRDNDRVLTPESIWRPCLEALRAELGDPAALFELDPAGAPGQDPIALQTLVPEEGGDGLVADWTGRTVWLNPPYAELQYPGRFPWLAKAQQADFTCAFLPARTAAGWWQDVAKVSRMVWLLRGRVIHKNAPLDKKGRPMGAPFAQCVMYLGQFAADVKPPALPGVRVACGG